LVLVALTSCSKHNPASCCTTQEQCNSLGIDQLYPCASGNVCDTTGTCVVGDCNSAVDCGGATPFCVGHTCATACASNNDCAADEAHPLCEPDGSCGACITSAACPTNTPICDSRSHDCRGCATGSECSASDVCETLTSTCVDPSSVVYVSDGGSDTGSCSLAAPCRTFDFAQSVRGSRTWIHILGAAFDAGLSGITLATAITVVDSDNAIVTGGGSGGTAPLVQTIANGDLTTVTIRATTFGTEGQTTPALASKVGAAITLEGVHLLQPFTNTGTLTIDDSMVEGSVANTSSGMLTIRRSTLKSGIAATSGTLVYQRNTFIHPTGRAIAAGSGVVTNIETSLFISDGATSSVIELAGNDQSFRFCTFVDRQPTSTAAITCTAPTAAHLDSNIFGWNGTLGGSCNATYSLFNSTSGAVPAGTGNIGGDVATYFVDLSGSDFYPSAASPAVRAANPASTSGIDHDGGARPSPVGTRFDIGAFESPN